MPRPVQGNHYGAVVSGFFVTSTPTMSQGSIGLWDGMREALEAVRRRPQSTIPTTF